MTRRTRGSPAAKSRGVAHALVVRSFPGTIDSLASISDLVSAEAAAAGLDRRATYRLCLAIDEVATNIVRHGYEDAGREGPLDLAVDVDGRAITVSLEDDGEPFDPRARPQPTEDELARPLEERSVGGLGLLLAADGVDEFRYERAQGRNRNVFVVRRPPLAGGPGQRSSR